MFIRYWRSLREFTLVYQSNNIPSHLSLLRKQLQNNVGPQIIPRRQRLGPTSTCLGGVHIAYPTTQEQDIIVTKKRDYYRNSLNKLASDYYSDHRIYLCCDKILNLNTQIDVLSQEISPPLPHCSSSRVNIQEYWNPYTKHRSHSKPKQSINPHSLEISFLGDFRYTDTDDSSKHIQCNFLENNLAVQIANNDDA